MGGLQATSYQALSAESAKPSTAEMTLAVANQDGVSLAETGIDPTGKALVWAVMTRLQAGVPVDGKEAFQAVQPFLGRVVDTAEGRAALIRALRTEELPHFKFDEVRAAAIESLAPYIGEGAVMHAIVEELENPNDRTKSCRSAVAALNEAKPIANQEIIERIFKLFLNGSIGTGAHFLNDLHPKLADGPNKATIAALRKGALNTISHNASEFSILNALAISNDRGCLELLHDMASQEVKEPSRLLAAFKKVAAWGTAAASVVALSLAAGTGGFYAGTLLNNAMNTWGAEWFFGVAATLIGTIVTLATPLRYWVMERFEERSSEFDFIRHKKPLLAINAIKALALVGDDKAARETLLKIFGDLENGQGVRMAALEMLAQSPDEVVGKVIQAATNDQYPEIRRAAYKKLDQISRA